MTASLHKSLGPELKRFRGRGAGGADFCLWVIPGILVPIGFFSAGVYFSVLDYAQSGFSAAGRPWFILAGALLVPFAILTFRRILAARRAVAVHRGGLRLVRPVGSTTSLGWKDIRAVQTSGTRVVFGSRSLGDRYKLSILTTDGRTINIPDRIEDPDALAAILRERIDSHVLPGMREQLARGEPAAFGPIQLDRNGLRMGRRTWAWAELDSLRITNGSLLIESAGNRASIPVTEIPNTTTLLELAAELGSSDSKR